MGGAAWAVYGLLSRVLTAEQVNEAGQTMEEVVTNFQKLSALVTEIAEASQEQSGGIEQVTQAVGQMDEVTQQNAALVEEAAAAAESLQEQSQSLVQAVSLFRLDGNAAAPQGGARPFAGPAALPSSAVRVASFPARQAKPVKIGSPLPKIKQQRASNLAEDEWEEF